MKKILIVEDQPELKINMLISLLKSQKVEFDYTIVKSISSAKRYLHNKENKVDLIITDLGLPIFDGERVRSLLEGIGFIYDLWDFEIKVPVIINSTTEIPASTKCVEDWEDMGLKVYKTDFILNMKDWIVEFLTN